MLYQCSVVQLLGNPCQSERQRPLTHNLSCYSQAQGLCLLMADGDYGKLRQAIADNNVLLAAHGPYTAAGAGQLLGLPITCVSQNYATFDGLVSALEQQFDSH